MRLANRTRFGSDRVVEGAAMIIGTSVSIQLAAAVAHSLFARLGPAGTSSIRFMLGASILLAIVRPRLRGRSAATWGAVAVYGVSLAALNVTYFEAIDRIPIGIAVTLSFAAPLTLALGTSRNRRDVLWALLAAIGVATLGGLDRPTSLLGVASALAAGCAWIVVAYAARRLGQTTSRLDGLALALPISAVLTLPFGVAHASGINLRTGLTGLAIAVGGLIFPFALELEGLRRLEPRTVAVIYSIDPAIGAIVGLVALGQQLSTMQITALLAVMLATAGATATARTDRSTRAARPRLARVSSTWRRRGLVPPGGPASHLPVDDAGATQ